MSANHEMETKAYIFSEIQVLADNLITLRKNQNLNLFLDLCNALFETIDNKGKLLFMGNGGSAAEATHLAAEFVGKCVNDVGPISAISLSDSNSVLTAIPNDFGFDFLFSRQVEALCRSEDLLIGLSTSGKSTNVLKGLEAGKAIGAKTSLWTGKIVDKLDFIDFQIMLDIDSTPRAQEIHLFLGHMLAEVFANRIK